MTVQEFKDSFPNLYFIKTKTKIDTKKPKNVGECWEVIQENFIPDEDMPELPDLETVYYGKKKFIPLAVTSFPGVLSRMSALKAGVWAYNKCEIENWEFCSDAIGCCLSNLEMDY